MTREEKYKILQENIGGLKISPWLLEAKQRQKIYTIERVYVDSEYNSTPVTVYATKDRRLAEAYCIRANRVTSNISLFYHKRVSGIWCKETSLEDEETYVDKWRWFRNIRFEVHTVPLLTK